jgi:hypothetical protein
MGKVAFVYNWMPHHEDIWGNRGVTPEMLILALRWCKWWASCPGHFLPGEKTTGTLWVRDFMGPRKQKENCCLCQKFNLGHPAHSQSSYRPSYLISNKTTGLVGNFTQKKLNTSVPKQILPRSRPVKNKSADCVYVYKIFLCSYGLMFPELFLWSEY